MIAQIFFRYVIAGILGSSFILPLNLSAGDNSKYTLSHPPGSDLYSRAFNGDPAAQEIAEAFYYGQGCGFVPPDVDEMMQTELTSSTPINCWGIELRANDPRVRDYWGTFGDTASNFAEVRLFFHVLAEDDGSNPAVTEQDIIDRVADINSAFAYTGIQFVYDWKIDSISFFRYGVPFGSAGEGYWPMKQFLVVEPQRQINVYVTDAAVSFQTFPWSIHALDTLGGIVMRIDHFTTDAWYLALQHELAHYFGLFHAFSGYQEAVNQIASCNAPCRENLGTGPTNNSGDFCYDTPPQPLSFTCAVPAGIDSCSGIPWTSVPPPNVMNYSVCRTGFTPNQTGIMLSTLDEKLRPIMQGASIDVSSHLISVNQSVNFGGVISETVTNWFWDFGDGMTAGVQSPSHQYQAPGLYDVTVEIETSTDTFLTQRTNFVGVEADSVIPQNVLALGGESVAVELYVRNYVPLTQLRIPFAWSGSLGLEFDSASNAGLTSEELTGAVVSLNPLSNQGHYVLTAKTNKILAPGNRSVARLYFNVPPGGGYDSGTVNIQSWSSNQLLFTAYQKHYSPDGLAGIVTRYCCQTPGDADSNGGITIADVTFLISRIFSGGQQPECCAEADANGSGSVNISDVTYLITYIFGSGPDPICGPNETGC